MSPKPKPVPKRLGPPPQLLTHGFGGQHMGKHAPMVSQQKGAGRLQVMATGTIFLCSFLFVIKSASKNISPKCEKGSWLLVKNSLITNRNQIHIFPKMQSDHKQNLSQGKTKIRALFPLERCGDENGSYFLGDNKKTNVESV